MPDYLRVRNRPVANGGYFTMPHLRVAAHLWVPCQTVAHELFDVARPVGETIVMEGMPCQASDTSCIAAGPVVALRLFMNPTLKKQDLLPPPGNLKICPG